MIRFHFSKLRKWDNSNKSAYINTTIETPQSNNWLFKSSDLAETDCLTSRDCFGQKFWLTIGHHRALKVSNYAEEIHLLEVPWKSHLWMVESHILICYTTDRFPGQQNKVNPKFKTSVCDRALDCSTKIAVQKWIDKKSVLSMNNTPLKVWCIVCGDFLTPFANTVHNLV